MEERRERVIELITPKVAPPSIDMAIDRILSLEDQILEFGNLLREERERATHIRRTIEREYERYARVRMVVNQRTGERLCIDNVVRDLDGFVVYVR